ncbi:MAG: tetratricopeptide repeat protein [Bacteroidia bacterium]
MKLFFIFILTPFLVLSTNLDSLKNKLLNSKEDTNKVKLIMAVAKAEFNKNLYIGNTNYLNRILPAINLSKKLNYKKGVYNAYYYICFLNTINKQFNINELYFDTISKYYNTNFDSSNYAKFLNIKSFNYIRQDKYFIAAKNLYEALTISEKQNDTLLISDTYKNLGILFFNISDYKKAIQFYLKASNLQQNLNDEKGIGVSYLNLGEAYREINNLDSSLYYYQNGLKLFIKNNRKAFQARVYEGIAQIYNLKQDYNTALHYLLKAKNLTANTYDLTNQTLVELEIAKCQLNLKNYKEAKSNFIKLINNQANYKDVSILMKTHYGLYKIFKIENNHKEAFNHYTLYNSYNDSLINQTSFKNLANIETEFLLNQEKELGLIERENIRDQFELDKKNKNLFILAIVIVLGLIVAFSIYLAWMFIQRKKKNKIILSQQTELNHQNDVIEEKQKEILDSIYCAKKIQIALLPNNKYLNKYLKNNL